MSPVFAQSADQEDDEAIIVTALGIEQPKSDANVAITLVTEDDLERRGAVTVLDQLAWTPGIAISRNGPLGGFAAVRIRGAEAEQTRVLIDGIAVNDPSSPGGSFDFGTLLASNIQSIEVLRGANSTTWGNQAIGGVVSIETLAPDDHGFTAQALGEYGSHDSRRASAGIAGQQGSVGYALGGGYYASDGISAAASGTEPDGMRQYLAHGRVDAELGDPLTLELRGFYTHSRIDLDGYNFTTFALEDQPLYSAAQQANGYGGLKLALADGRFISRLGYSIADINRDNYDPHSGTAPTFKARGRTETIAYKGDWTVASGHRLLFGLERETNRLSTADNWSSLKASNHNDSGYAQWLFQPDDKFNLVAGVRHDQHSDYGGHTSFAANGAYQILPALRLRAGYSEGYKAPTLFQLDGSAFGYGNPGLKPETARSIDAGADVRLLNGALLFSASLFTRTTRDQIAYGYCPATNPTPAICDNGKRPYGTYFNLAKTRARGAEFEITAQPIPSLTFSANYTLLNAKDIATGNTTFGKQLARRPKHSAHASLDYEAPSGWSIGGDMSMVGDSFDDAGNFRRLEGYQLFGLRAAVPVGGIVTLFARAENLTDERYQTAADYASLGRTFYAGVRVRY